MSSFIGIELILRGWLFDVVGFEDAHEHIVVTARRPRLPAGVLEALGVQSLADALRARGTAQRASAGEATRQ